VPAHPQGPNSADRPSASPLAALPADAIEVGGIAGAWGIQGALKTIPASRDASVLLTAKAWWLVPPSLLPRTSPPSHGIHCVVVQARAHGDAVVASLSSITDRDAAERLARHSIYVSRAAFPKAARDEFYWVDLMGCAVVNREGLALGTVVGLIDTGAHSVLRVALEASPSAGAARAPDAQERLIPFVDAYVDHVDLAAKRVDVDWGEDF
jgi:16S rRNA processing protein RimM